MSIRMVPEIVYKLVTYTVTASVHFCFLENYTSHLTVSTSTMLGVELVVLALGLSVALADSNYGQFHGRYGGRCDRDGFYYKDQGSMVICSNNNAYVQPCAPGTRNSNYNSYNRGGHYHYRDFCDVNLVDHGYGASHGYGTDHGHRNSYGHNTYDHGNSYGHSNHGPGNAYSQSGRGTSYGHGHGDSYGHIAHAPGNLYGHSDHGHGNVYGQRGHDGFHGRVGGSFGHVVHGGTSYGKH